MLKKRLLTLLLAGATALATLVCGLTACSITDSASDSINDSTDELNTEMQINVSVLSGTTGYGMVKLMDDAQKDAASLNYEITVETAVTAVQSALINGSVDIAALPTNKAALIANQTNGKIRMAAVNTLGVMYLVTTNGETLSDFEALKGKTIGIPLEPSYILTALCEANGLTVGTDVTIQTYATPAELQKSVIAGTTEYAVLPEPLLSTAMSKKDNIKVSMDLTEEWEKIYSGKKLMQGCIVVRTAWANEHPAELNQFLKEYQASVTYVNENPAEAGGLVETYIGTAAAVAKNAIPRCNLTYIAGAEMKTQLSALYNVLKDIPAANIGAVPGDEFYYIAK